MPDKTEGLLGDTSGLDGDRPSAVGVGVGGSRPSETGTGGGTPTGGGQAVPTDSTLMGGDSALGDAGSLDDGPNNSGDRVADESGTVSGPQMSPDSAGQSEKSADAPTGGVGAKSSV